MHLPVNNTPTVGIHTLSLHDALPISLALTLLASARLRHSRIGWAWQAIREDELAARAMGINTTVAKLQAFAIGASFAGIGGSFLASWQRSVFPENFLFTE